MRYGFIALIFIMIMLLVANSTIACACDEHQTATYLSQLLFGVNAAKWTSSDNMTVLIDGLYLCSIQSDGEGLEQLGFLIDHNVPDIPSLQDITVKSNHLLDYSHNNWNTSGSSKIQTVRKTVLTNAVNTAFGMTFIDHTIGSILGGTKNIKCESLAKLLYYSHILFDYLADDPEETEITIDDYPVLAFSGSPYIELNGNEPMFSKSDLQRTIPFQEYSCLDSQNRAGVAFVNVCYKSMPPPNSREQIGRIWPSGWHQKDGGYPVMVNSTPPLLYNRCHLVAHELSGKDEKTNLITGTRYLNIYGMKPFEDRVAKYLELNQENHVLYRATPVYNGENELASGVQIEAYSIEDHGEGICFNVYCYNVQPGVDIEYTHGTNSLADVTFESTSIMPFAVYGAGDLNSDLIYEIDKILAILFADQVDSDTYIDMRKKIDAVAIEARNNGYFYDRTAVKYAKEKRLQYDYFEVLKSYVPLLLSKESFFTSTFK